MILWQLPSLWPTMLYPQSSLSKISTAAASSGECFSVSGWSVKYWALARASSGSNAQRILVVLKQRMWIFLDQLLNHIYMFQKNAKPLMLIIFPRPFTHLNVWTGNNTVANLDVGAHATRTLTLAREPHVLLITLPSCRLAEGSIGWVDWMRGCLQNPNNINFWIACPKHQGTIGWGFFW